MHVCLFRLSLPFMRHSYAQWQCYLVVIAILQFPSRPGYSGIAFKEWCADNGFNGLSGMASRRRPRRQRADTRRDSVWSLSHGMQPAPVGV